MADERLLLQVPEVARSVCDEQAFAMRQRTLILWEEYFSSLEIILQRTLEIIFRRIDPLSTIQNLPTGLLPAEQQQQQHERFTAVVYPRGERACSIHKTKAILRSIAATQLVEEVGKLNRFSNS